MKEIERCSRCILPVGFPGVAFDDQGVCSLCSENKASSVLGRDSLIEILNSERGQKYDCVIPISGGKDSTYVLQYAVNTLGLRVIAANYDSGFQSDLAKSNVRDICKRLKVPLVIQQVDYGTQVKMLKEILHISEILGSFFHACMNCEASIRTLSINTARENQVPFILYGSSKLEEIGKEPFLGWKAFFSKIPIKSVPRLCFHATKYSLYSILQRINIKVPIRYRFIPVGSVPFPKKRPRVIRFFDYVEWDSMDKVGFLARELGWKYPGDRKNRFDCLLHCFGNHHWLQECGISVDGFTYSTMIREDRIKREDAILSEREIIERLEQECLDTAAKVGLEDYGIPSI
jgi:hypothetical protein